MMGEEIFNRDKWYFAGGCVYCLYNNKPINDYDLFCMDKSEVKKILKWFNEHKDVVTFKSDYAYTVGKIQFIIRFIGDPEIEVSKFDFKHNQCYYTSDGVVHLLAPEEIISSNKLVPNTSKGRDLMTTIGRVAKFTSRGMEISQTDLFDLTLKATEPKSYFSGRRSLKRRIKQKYRY